MNAFHPGTPAPTPAPTDAGNAHSPNVLTSRGGSPLAFFVLVFTLSVPFWLIGGATKFQLAPGLPVAALMAVCPLTAALILVYREEKVAGVTALLKRSFDYKRIRSTVWYAPILLLLPALMVMAYGTMRLLDVPLPRSHVPLLMAPVLFLAFFVGALGEELGWSGYVIDPLQNRWSAFQASVLVGLVMATWHVVPLVQADRPATWIARWCLSTVSLRVLFTWLYNNTGKSVFGAALFHATFNVSWQLFPNRGSHFDPRITGIIITMAAALVTVTWGPRTLARFRNT